MAALDGLEGAGETVADIKRYSSNLKVSHVDDRELTDSLKALVQSVVKGDRAAAAAQLQDVLAVVQRVEIVAELDDDLQGEVMAVQDATKELLTALKECVNQESDAQRAVLQAAKVLKDAVVQTAIAMMPEQRRGSKIARTTTPQLPVSESESSSEVSTSISSSSVGSNVASRSPSLPSLQIDQGTYDSPPSLGTPSSADASRRSSFTSLDEHERDTKRDTVFLLMPPVDPEPVVLSLSYIRRKDPPGFASLRMLERFLLESDLAWHFLDVLNTVTPRSERDEVAAALSVIFQHRQADLSLMTWAVATEVAQCTEEKALSRNDDLLAKIIYMYCKTWGTNHLFLTLDPVIEEINIGQNMEIDPNRANPQDLEGNIDRFKLLVERAIGDLFNTARRCPLPMKLLWKQLQADTINKYPALRNRVANVFFLRFACPALLNPGALNPFKRHLLERGASAPQLSDSTRPMGEPDGSHRAVLHLCKFMHCLGLDAPFTAREPQMLPLNELLTKCRERIPAFIDDLAKLPETGAPSASVAATSDELQITSLQLLRRTLQSHLPGFRHYLAPLNAPENSRQVMRAIDDILAAPSPPEDPASQFVCVAAHLDLLLNASMLKEREALAAEIGARRKDRMRQGMTAVQRTASSPMPILTTTLTPREQRPVSLEKLAPLALDNSPKNSSKVSPRVGTPTPTSSSSGSPTTPSHNGREWSKDQPMTGDEAAAECTRAQWLSFSKDGRKWEARQWCVLRGRELLVFTDRRSLKPLPVVIRVDKYCQVDLAKGEFGANGLKLSNHTGHWWLSCDTSSELLVWKSLLEKNRDKYNYAKK